MRGLIFRIPLLLGGLLLILSACGDDGGEKAKAKKKGPPHLVEVSLAQNAPLSFETVRTGTLAARKSVRVFNQEEGRIDKITVREGDAVKAGQIIVELDRRILSAELVKAKAIRLEAEGNLARVLELSKRKVATQERLDKTDTALSIAKAEESLIRTRLEYSQIRSPFDGIVTERRTEPGDVAPRNSHLLTIIDPNSLFTQVSVSELMIPQLQVNGKAEVRIDALGNAAWTGRLVRIHPVIDPRTRQGTVEVELDPVPPGVTAGQLARVRLRTPEAQRLVIPFAALRHDREGEFVFLVENDKVAMRRVQPGLRFEDRAEILDGLKAGERVVIRGFLDISVGKTVAIVDAVGKNDQNKKDEPVKKSGEGK